MTDGLYQVAQVVVVAGWALFMAEYISTLLMLPWTFRLGVPSSAPVDEPPGLPPVE